MRYSIQVFGMCIFVIIIIVTPTIFQRINDLCGSHDIFEDRETICDERAYSAV